MLSMLIFCYNCIIKSVTYHKMFQLSCFEDPFRKLTSQRKSMEISQSNVIIYLSLKDKEPNSTVRNVFSSIDRARLRDL